MAKVIAVNTQIMKSIPIDNGLKRYLIKWFSKMCECNGPIFAVSKVKGLRELLMRYIADPNRLQKINDYLIEAPIRKNHRLSQIFSYGDTNPIAILAFLKMYLGEAEPLVSPKQSAREMHSLLTDIDHDPEIPGFLQLWLCYLRIPYKELIPVYWYIRSTPEHMFHYVACHHTLDEWSKYWSTWKGRLLKGASIGYYSATYENVAEMVPVPSMYADLFTNRNGELRSKQFEDDVNQFLGYFPDCRGGTETVPVDILDWLLSKEDSSLVFGQYELDEIVDDLSPDYWSVGQIHHIPKKGTVVRRPIAVPNRFLQRGLLPYQRFLYVILRGLPRDHTFDQTKSASYVKHRIDSGFYTCSVDLSHATDYLPKVVGDYIVSSILPRDALRLEECPEEERILRDVFGHPQQNEDFIRSRDLFDFMSRAPWQNSEFLDSWKTGQPLGTLPSFGLLALEHNVLLEALALSCGYLHSPYTVLGDDVLLFSKRMRKAYIKVMQELGVPLSLHKSYEHNLVEFAGQVLIRNQPTSYIPDPLKVSKYNLFDYSRNSGILLSYRELPHSIQKWLTRKAQNVSLPGNKFYRLCAELYFAYYGSPYDSYMDYSMEVLPYFVEAVESNKRLIPDLPEKTSGWTVVVRHDIPRLLYTGKGFRRKPDKDQDWFKQKYKPLTTNAIIAYTMRAVELSTLHDESKR